MMILWWVGDALLLFAVLPVVLVLLNRVVTPIGRIRVTVDNILKHGASLTGELDNVPQLLTKTDETVQEVCVGATRYVTSALGLLK